MTEQRLEQIKQIRAYGLQAEPTALLLAIDDLLAGAAVSASPQPRCPKCGGDVDFISGQSTIECRANNNHYWTDSDLLHVSDFTQFFALAPAQEPPHKVFKHSGLGHGREMSRPSGPSAPKVETESKILCGNCKQNSYLVTHSALGVILKCIHCRESKLIELPPARPGNGYGLRAAEGR